MEGWAEVVLAKWRRLCRRRASLEEESKKGEERCAILFIVLENVPVFCERVCVCAWVFVSI
jgi:hypothetical protein